MLTPYRLINQHHSTTPTPHTMLKKNNYIIVQRSNNKWYISQITSITENKLTIHFIGWSAMCNEIIISSSPRIKPLNEIRLIHNTSDFLKHCFGKHGPYVNVDHTIHITSTPTKNKISEDIIHKDLGNLITEFVPKYYIRNIRLNWRTNRRVYNRKLSDICIDEFVNTQSLNRLKQLCLLFE